jgi:hypothetical protein
VALAEPWGTHGARGCFPGEVQAVFPQAQLPPLRGHQRGRRCQPQATYWRAAESVLLLAGLAVFITASRRGPGSGALGAAREGGEAAGEGLYRSQVLMASTGPTEHFAAPAAQSGANSNPIVARL